MKPFVFKLEAKMTQNNIDTIRWLVEKHGTIVHKGSFAAICRWIEERRKTVRSKRPVQQSRAKICPQCRGKGEYWSGNGVSTLNKCDLCEGSGKLLPC